MIRIRAFCLVALIAATISVSQPQRQMMTFSAYDAFILREVGAVVLQNDGALVVAIVPAKDQRPKETQDVNIEKDDKVMMANGKRVKNIKELRNAYEKTEVGAEFKLGMKRGEDLLIATITRKSAEDLDKQGGTMTMHMSKKEGEEVLPALGLIVGTKNKHVSVNGVLPTASGNFKEFMPKEGDAILSINATSVSDVREFVGMYDEIKTASPVRIVFQRGEKADTVDFKKPQPQGRMIIRK